MNQTKTHTKNPIIIGGMMKSGTSLLRALLGNHSQISSGLETWWFSENFQKEFKDADSKTAQKLMYFYNTSPEVYQKLANQAQHHVDFLAVFMQHIAENQQKSRWVEKTPDNIFYLDMLWKKWNEDFFFIYCLRNPLDIFASWKKNTSYTLDFFLSKMKETEAVFQQETFQDFQHKYLISYENLVQYPKESLAKLVLFVGEEWEEGIEKNQKDMTEYNMVRQFANKESTTLVSLSKPIFQSSIGQHLTILTPEEIEKIEHELPVYWETYRDVSQNQTN